MEGLSLCCPLFECQTCPLKLCNVSEIEAWKSCIVFVAIAFHKNEFYNKHHVCEY